MHIYYFPVCPVNGPIDPPEPFHHMSSKGAVPAKCAQCQYLFEGECTRYFEQVGRYMRLDHGPCGVEGPTDPVLYEDAFIKAKAEVPRKCSKCVFLNYDPIFGFHCTKDSKKWGDLYRGLDWGNWRPDYIYLELPAPKHSTKKLSQCAFNNDQLAFVKEHRRINPGLPLDEVKADFKFFRRIMDIHGHT